MNRNIQQLVRPSILNLNPYSSARDEFEGEADIYLDANESPFGKFNRYPDPMQNRLKERLAGMKGVDLDQLFLGNGSDECIDLLFRIFCVPGVDKALTFVPTYGMYEVSAGINNVALLKLPLNQDFKINEGDILPYLSEHSLKIIFLCSPNNPTGNLIAQESVTYILDHFDGIVVIDEAYIDFADTASWTTKISEYDHLVVLQTLSKAYGMANLRIGMAMSSPEIIKLLCKVKPPYNISGLVQATALDLLENSVRHAKNTTLIISERSKLVRKLIALSSITKVYPSEANFVLVELQNAVQRYEALREIGIIVRNRVQIVANCLRITIGSPDENSALIKALQSFDNVKFED